MTGIRRLSVVQVAATAQWAGGERYLELLARHVDRARVALSVVAPERGPLGAALAALEVPVQVAPLARLVDVAGVRALAVLLRRLAPDVVQSHGARVNFYARLAGRLARIPVVISTVHNALRDYPVSPARRALYMTLDRLTLPLASRVLCVAGALARDYGARATVIHNGVDVSAFDPEALRGDKGRRELGLEGVPVVGFVGRLTPQKDPLAFLDALALLQRDVPGVHGLLVGDGPLRPDVEAARARLGLAPVCRLTGARADVPRMLAAMDVVLCPSVSEGFPFVVLEAMAMARAVVVTPVNGVAEIIEDGVCGLVVPPRQPAALAAAALRALKEPALARRLADAARRRVLERFSAEQMVRRTERLWHSLRADAGRER